MLIPVKNPQSVLVFLNKNNPKICDLGLLITTSFNGLC
ncbi:hypothetical protein BSM4216_3080 [Bacillus smithii]|nr:hypothetical protein BSM4216_3080 [Bacillus smithii]